MKSLMQATALLAATCVAGAASAQSLATMPGAPGGHGPIKVLVIISSHGLNLSSEAGADLFMSRIDTAVTRACDERRADGPSLAVEPTAGFLMCRSQVLETAMSYVRSPIVRRRFAAMEAKEAYRLARR